MSLENQVTRVSQGAKDTLKALINMMGGNITDELIDQYPAIASQLLPPTGITGNTVTVTAKEQLDAGNMIIILQNGDGYDAYKATTEGVAISNFWLGIAKDTVLADAVADVISIAYMEASSDFVVEQNNGNEQKFWVGTQAEYDSLTAKDSNTMYITVDEDGNFVDPGDMKSSVYDPQGKATDIFSYVDQKVSSIPTPDVSGQINTHNTNTEAHNDIRELINGLTTRLNALADSDDTTLDQLSEIVAYIKNNKSLIDGITTSKVNVADIIDNLTTNVSNKPLSAAQGVVLKALIDAIAVPTKVSELTNDSGYLTSFTETDPTVPAWAKAASKPTYTASEVGAATMTEVNSAIQTAIGNAIGGSY